MAFNNIRIHGENSSRVFLIILAVILIFNCQVLGSDSGRSLSGIVIDIETNQPVSQAYVSLPDLNLQKLTDSEGRFSFRDIKSEKVEIVVKRIGYRENILTIRLEFEKPEEIVIYLQKILLNDRDVIVTGNRTNTKFDELAEYRDVLKGRELQKELGNSLAATLKNETGLAMRTMGPAPARPVIRGLSGDRVQICEDNHKTIDLSATSADHAVTVEPFSLKRLEIIRGPRVLLKTPSTLGGIVNVVRDDIPSEKPESFQGVIGSYGETANEGSLGSLRTSMPVDPFVFTAGFNRRSSTDMDTPLGKLANSYADNFEGGIGGSLIGKAGYIGTSFRYYSLDYGIPGGFAGGHPNGVDIEMLKRQNDFKSRLNINSEHFTNVEFSFNRSYYRHKEFESNRSIGSEFRIIDHNGFINLNYSDLGYSNNGILGISFEHRDFDIGGLVFNPPTKSVNLSTYFYQFNNHNNLNLEYAFRYNYDRVDPEEDNPESNIGFIRTRTFHTYSLSLSGILELNNSSGIGANLSKSSRVPTIEELFSEGPHLAAYSYEIGNPDLESENGIGTELFSYFKNSRIYFMIGAYYNNISNFIIPRNTGEINYATFLPVYSSQGVPAVLYGFENQVKLKLTSSLTITNSISYTRGEFRDQNGFLPQIPPMNGRIEIDFTNSGLSAGVALRWASRQDKVDEFEEPTAGYAVLDGSIRYIVSSKNLIHSITLSFDNIFDTEYRNHLSRVKSILPESGTNIRASYKLYFSL